MKKLNSLILAGLLIANAFAWHAALATPPVVVVPVPEEKPHVVWWAWIDGCPKNAFRLIIVLSDGKIVMLDEDSPIELRQSAAIALGKVKGAATAFNCGTMT